MIRYFLTVDRCNKDERGIFSHESGSSFSSKLPHSEKEMHKILGPFWIILNPKSEPFTEEELKEYCCFTPLAEYSDEYGIVRRSDESS